jgi:hypothetical protein
MSWALATPTKWLGEQRESYADVESGDSEWALVKEAITEALRRQRWRGAAGRADGAGLEAGAAFEVPRSLPARRQKEGRHDLAGVVALVATGGQWAAERRNKVDQPRPQELRCTKCGE